MGTTKLCFGTFHLPDAGCHRWQAGNEILTNLITRTFCSFSRFSLLFLTFEANSLMKPPFDHFFRRDERKAPMLLENFLIMAVTV